MLAPGKASGKSFTGPLGALRGGLTGAGGKFSMGPLGPLQPGGSIQLRK